VLEKGQNFRTSAKRGYKRRRGAMSSGPEKRGSEKGNRGLFLKKKRGGGGDGGGEIYLWKNPTGSSKDSRTD